jgi:hypothetical protein
MDPERRAAHEQRFVEAKRIATLAFFHHEIIDSRDGPFCGKCGISLDTPRAMLSPCALARRCETCANRGVVVRAVLCAPLNGTWVVRTARIPCPMCFEFMRAFEEEYWSVVGETLVELNARKSRRTNPPSKTGFA